jgi:hypothetical protein
MSDTVKQYGVRAVSGAAYVDLERGQRTHAVELSDGFAVRVLCRVKVENICDDEYALTAAETAAGPTCKTCAARLAKASG